MTWRTTTSGITRGHLTTIERRVPGTPRVSTARGNRTLTMPRTTQRWWAVRGCRVLGTSLGPHPAIVNDVRVYERHTRPPKDRRLRVTWESAIPLLTWGQVIARSNPVSPTRERGRKRTYRRSPTAEEAVAAVKAMSAARRSRGYRDGAAKPYFAPVQGTDPDNPRS